MRNQFKCLRELLNNAAPTFLAGTIALAGCGGRSLGPTRASAAAPVSQQLTGAVRTTAALATNRAGFLGAFFRPEGAAPYGVILPQSS
jgi:hypothetical protein